MLPCDAKLFKCEVSDLMKEFGERIEKAINVLYQMDIMKVEENMIIRKICEETAKIRDFGLKNEGSIGKI